MEFKFKNFGKAGSGTVRIRDLTVICGPNNSGKSYINYAIYSILNNFQALFDFGVDEESIKDALVGLKSNGSVIIDLSGIPNHLCRVKSSFVRIIGPEIGDYFQLPRSNFENTEIFIKLDEFKLRSDKGLIQLTNDLFCGYEFENNKCELHLCLQEKETQMSSECWAEPSFSQFVIQQIKYLIFNVYFAEIIPNPFPISSDRTGISLFYKAFDYGNKEAVKFVNSRINRNEIRDIIKVGSSFSEAVGDDIDFTRFFEEYSSRNSFIVEEKLNDVVRLFDEIIDGGKYESRNNSLYYRPKNTANEPTIPLESSSSLIKSFFLFDLFIRNVANKGDMLIIEEPELNLHIENQIEITHLLARLVNAGVKVLITTHSDFLVKEVNNLISLSSSKKEDRKKLMNEYGLLETDVLYQSQVSAYSTSLQKKIKPLTMHTSGIDPDQWNKVIARENYKSRRIFDLIPD